MGLDPHNWYVGDRNDFRESPLATYHRVQWLLTRRTMGLSKRASGKGYYYSKIYLYTYSPAYGNSMIHDPLSSAVRTPR